tara:strand:+ start:224 stop:379 length:156 start_codon:yes stop_codon:yes gene_type:complete
MHSKTNKNKILKKIVIEKIIKGNDCIASKASAEIMLHRFYNGKEICFPFSK